MKGLIIFLSVVMMPAVLSAQSKKVKVYAFQQGVIPGRRNTTIDESGKTSETPPKVTNNTLLYLEIPHNKKVDPKHVWINGKLFDLKTSIATSPVIIGNTTYPGKKADTLVRSTTNTVLQLTPSSASGTFNASSAAKRKMKSNDIVLHTVENGKNCYYYVQHIKKLDPVVLQ
jgi:hypothetical protein